MRAAEKVPGARLNRAVAVAHNPPEALRAEAASVKDTDQDLDVEALGHPRGTLAIVIVYGVLFLLGWLAFYLFGFLPRGAPHS